MQESAPSPTPKTDWPHAPVHRLGDAGTYFVTAGTYGKQPFFAGAERLGVLHRGLLAVAKRYGWLLEAWAVFANHYHFVGQASDSAESLPLMLKMLHSKTSGWVNRIDKAVGRRVWHNYWDTELTYRNSYMARLNYVHQNPVKHGLVPLASRYPFGSAAWFERTASPAQVRSVYSFDTDQVRVQDDFVVAW